MKKNFFGQKEEKTYWERWIIPLTFTAEKDKPKSQSDHDRVSQERQSRLTDNLLYLVGCVNDKKDHIPPTKSSTQVALAFSFEITHSTGEKQDESWGDAFKVRADKDTREEMKSYTPVTRWEHFALLIWDINAAVVVVVVGLILF